ncbi:NACHT, LRR and PYD domains-containing protein 3-like, partial [Gastrophryne carolinensis]
KLKMSLPGDRLMEFQKQYMASTKEKCQKILECNFDSMKERSPHLKKLTHQWSWSTCEKVHEIEHSGRHLSNMRINNGIADSSSPTTIQALFDPDENQASPKLVVLQGAAGIGKTTTCQKLLRDWASGTLYQDKFDFLFYLSCRVLNTVAGNVSLVGLLSGTLDSQCSEELESLLNDPRRHERLLFILDGFDEFRWTLEIGQKEGQSEIGQEDVFRKTHKDALLQDLLRKQILKRSSIIVTTRPWALEKLSRLIGEARYVEVLGFREEDLKEYAQSVFETKEDAEKALGIINANHVLLAMCSIPVSCRMICSTIKPRIHLDVDLVGCKTATSVYLLYVKGLIRPCADKQAISTCLRKLCALANEGILKRQVLFNEEDLERQGLSLFEVESVFQSELLFYRDVETEAYYSFLHLILQELFAALHYVLEAGSGSSDETSDADRTSDASIPEIYQGTFFSALYNHHLHLTFVLRFQFGLLNESDIKALAECTGCSVSLRAKSVMGEWLTEDNASIYFAAAIFCLYETQDPDFIRRIMSRSSSLHITLEIHGRLMITKNALQQFCYCLKLCDNIESLSFSGIIMEPESLEMLFPILRRCQKLRFCCCEVTPACCAVLSSVLTENPSLIRLDLSENPIEDAGVKALCVGLRYPSCALQELSFLRCDLTPGCCEDLSSVFSTSRTLFKLDLSINDIESSGTTHLCEGLRHPGCTLQELSLEYCDVKGLCCDDLRSVLLTNRSLTKLILTRNPLGDIGVKALCEALRDPSCTLQELSLDGCEATTSCCEDFRSVLVTNRSLTKLDLCSMDLKFSGVRVICDGLTDPGQDLPEPRVELETTLLVTVNSWEQGVAAWVESLRQKGCRKHFVSSIGQLETLSEERTPLNKQMTESIRLPLLAYVNNLQKSAMTAPDRWISEL